MKKIVAMLLAVALTFSLAGFAMADSSAEYELKVSTVLSETEVLYKSLVQFADAVKERTGGAVEVTVFANGQLGTDEDVIEQAIIGNNVADIADPGRLALYNPDFGVLGAPYLLESYEEIDALLNTDTFKALCDTLPQHGLKILSHNWFQGTRNIISKDPINSLEDFKNVRLRSSGSDVVTKTVEALGCTAVVCPGSEIYQYLQNKQLDAAEVSYSSMFDSSFYEEAPCVATTEHFYLLTGLVVSNSWFESLPEEYQNILIEEAEIAGKNCSDEVNAQSEVYKQKLADAGCTMTEPDQAELKEATAGVYDELGYAEIRDQLFAEMGK